MTPIRRTLVFTDIEGSTALAERLGDRDWVDLLRAHNALIRAEVARHGGREVKFCGDGFLLCFAGEREGAECAIGIQRAFEGWFQTGGPRIRIRIGVHAGEVFEVDGDVLGIEVARAARVAALARGGEILLSSAARAALDPGGQYGPAFAVQLRGISGPHELYPARWRPACEAEAVAA
jgi:class 3 adenylate cyclase